MVRGQGIKPIKSIRIDPDVLHQARVTAVTARKTLGVWLEEAIQEKIERDRKGGSNVTEEGS